MVAVDLPPGKGYAVYIRGFEWQVWDNISLSVGPLLELLSFRFTYVLTVALRFSLIGLHSFWELSCLQLLYMGSM